MKYNNLAVISALSVLLCACGSNEAAAAQPMEDPYGGAPQEEYTGITPDNAKEFAFESFTPIDTDGFAVTVKDIDPSRSFDINFELENKSSDTTYYFTVSSVAINGVNVSGYMNASAGPSQTSSQPLQLSYGFKSWGIGKYTDIEVNMYVSKQMYGEDVVADETFHIYPYGEDKAEKYVHEPAETDQILIDDDLIRLTLVTELKADMVPPEAEGAQIQMFVESKTDRTIGISIQNASVNDWILERSGAYSMLEPGQCSFLFLMLDGAELKADEIEMIEELEFELSLRDPDIYEEIESQTITLNP